MCKPCRFSFDDDRKESLKSHVLISLIFILKCLPKSTRCYYNISCVSLKSSTQILKVSFSSIEQRQFMSPESADSNFAEISFASLGIDAKKPKSVF